MAAYRSCDRHLPAAGQLYHWEINMLKYISFNCLCGANNKVSMVGNNNANGKSKCICGRNITIHLRKHKQKVASQQTVEDRMAKFVENQQDMPEGFSKMVDKHFDELI